jgi:hypothetical protein
MECPKCQGVGEVTFEEDGRQVTDACYHCQRTGQIDPEQMWADTVAALAAELAHAVVANREASWNAAFKRGEVDEPWDFAAAENGISAYDYRIECENAETDKLMRLFAEYDRSLLEVLVDKVLPKPPVVEVKPAVTTAPVPAGHDPYEAFDKARPLAPGSVRIPGSDDFDDIDIPF